MMSTLVTSIITVLLSFLSRSNTTPGPTRSPTESPTGAFLAFPSVVDDELFHEYFPVAPSQFGYHKFGGELEGILILPANETYHKECPPGGLGSCTDCAHEPLGINPYIHYIHDWFISDNDVKNYILIIDRLDCYFVNKIEYAEQLGASGVIICDWRVESLFTMWMPNDWEDDINIPSVLLQNKYCQKLMRHLGVQNWDPEHPENMKYPTPEQMNWTIATIEWSLLHPDDRVEYELWTSSNDYLGSRFKHHFNTTAIELDKANDTSFTPHMYILNGSHWGCDEIVNGTATLPCGQQCTNNGRYCAVDPEYDLEIGLDGMDVIQENLRSLCVWEYDKLMHKGTDDIMWWDYAVLWDENCGVYANDSTNFHASCSWAQMDKLDTTHGLYNFVQNCIINSGGYNYTDGVNYILKTETKLKYNSSIHSVPMVRVNGYLIHGNIDCPPPVTAVTCQVLDAICAGFEPGSEPELCDWTPTPTIAICNDIDRDCSGECYGSYIIDACGKCLAVSDPLWNECIGCNGQINETKIDCSGECGGHFAVNTCGYCKDIRATDFSTFGVDCRGGCDINLKEDECGECKTESNHTWNHCIGCDGIAYSDFKFNPCGRCIDSKRIDFNVFGEDCADTCDGNAQYDLCGQCLLHKESSTEWNNCVDCENIPNGPNKMNQCGFCLNTNIYGTDDKFTNYGMDCHGICEGGFTLDECGQCLLPTDNEFNNCCGGNIKKRYNQCGLCLYLNTTDFKEKGKDCQGICEGKFVVDACGHCLDPSDSKFDDCMNCGDNNGLKYDCNDVCGGNATINPCKMCIDTNLANFNTYGQDCSGTCNGNFAFDECNVCLHKESSDWNSCIGCDNIPNSEQIKNECGVCADPHDPHFDEYGKDCSGECARVVGEQHYIDECGNCLLPNDDAWNECMDGHGSTSGNNDGVFGNNTTLIIIISVAALMLICCAFIAIVYLYKKHSEMKRNVQEILQTYKPMDEIAPTQRQRGLTTALNEETN